MPTAAILRHELPDGSWHYDWLIATAGHQGDDERDLLAFRIPVLPWEAGGLFDAERLEPHRRIYLRYEGEIGGGRGRVVAVWRGDGRVLADRGGVVEVVLTIAATEKRFVGRGEGARWRFTPA